MDISTVAGIAAGVLLVLISIFLGGGLLAFFNVPSLLIVVGGSMAATMANFPMEEMKSLVRVTRKALFHKLPTANETIVRIKKLSMKARKEGVLALEPELKNIDDPFLHKGLQMAIDGVDSDKIRGILMNEVTYIKDRHKVGQGIFNVMATFAPAFGMIGTLIGLIQMLRNLDDPSAIGPGMAVALLTTFYGACMANMFCMPLNGKLKRRSEEESKLKVLVIEGILSIQAGDNPQIIESKLNSFVSPGERLEG